MHLSISFNFFDKYRKQCDWCVKFAEVLRRLLKLFEILFEMEST